MLRSIARVDVKATEVANFKLSGVKAYRANDHLQIIPDETGVVRVTLPSVPAGSTGNVNSVLYPVSVENLNEFSAQLYLPEADSPARTIGLVRQPVLLWRVIMKEVINRVTTVWILIR